MLPKMPQASTTSAGTAPARQSLVDASPSTTSTPPSTPASVAAARASATSCGSSSTRRARTAPAAGFPTSAPITSRPWPAERLTIRVSAAPRRESSSRTWRCTISRRRFNGDPSISYMRCQLTQWESTVMCRAPRDALIDTHRICASHRSASCLPIGRPHTSGSAANGGGRSDLEEQRDRAVVHERHLHVGSEAAGFDGRAEGAQRCRRTPPPAVRRSPVARRSPTRVCALAWCRHRA